MIVSMNVLGLNSGVDVLKITTNLVGKCSIYPKYSYTLIPPTKNDPSIFKMVGEYELVGDISGKIIYKATSVINFDSEEKVPSI